ncbi:TEL2-interacting protein 1 [Entophlyctis luteolus]|nr:TEL2-interacting protein 1 [Entophlyctis luteolus]
MQSDLATIFATLSSDSATSVAREAAARKLPGALNASSVSPSLFKEILIATPILLVHGTIPASLKQTPSSAKSNISEEFKTDILKALAAVLSPESHSRFSAMLIRDPKLVPYYAHAISTIVDILSPTQKVGSKGLLLQCLRCLHLIVDGISPESASKVMPGIVSALVVFLEAMGNRMNTGSQIICDTLSLLGVVLTKSIGDTDIEWLDNIDYERKEGKKKLDADYSRDIAWLNATQTRVAQVVERVFTPTSKAHRHQNAKVRMAYLSLAFDLLNDCRTSISTEATVVTLLQCLVGFVSDEVESVNTKAVECFRIICSPERVRALMERMLKLAGDDIPRCLEKADADEKADQLKMFRSCLSCLGNSDLSFGESFVILRENYEFQLAVDEFLESVLKNLSFSNSNISLIQDRRLVPAISLGGSLEVAFESKWFESNQSEQVLTEIARVMKSLAQYGNMSMIFNKLFDELNKVEVEDKSVVVFLLNQFGRGMRFSDKIEEPQATELSQSIIQNSLMSYLNSNILSLPASLHEESSTNSSAEKTLIKRINGNIICIDLILDGIAIFAENLGVNFSPFLMDVLYPVIEKIGSSNRSISYAATRALGIIAMHCSSSAMSIPELIGENMDYLINDLSLRLRYLDVYPQAPRVLVAVLRVAPAASIPLLDAVFEDLIDAIDSNMDSNHHVISIFGALDELVTVLQSESRSKRTSNGVLSVDHSVREQERVSKQIRSFEDKFRERQARFRSIDEDLQSVPDHGEMPFVAPTSESDGQLEQSDEPVTETNNDTAEIILLPPEQIAQKILTVAQHFLSRTDPYMQGLVLRLCAKSCTLLASQKNTLNPLVHILWPSVIRSLQSSYHFVILDSLRLIAEFAAVSREFLMKRFVSDLLPRLESVLVEFVEKPSNTNSKRNKSQVILSSNTSAMRDVHSVIFQVILSALETLANVVNSVDTLQTRELSRIVDIVWPFLTSRTHEKLRDMACAVVVGVGKRDANDIWLRVECVRKLKADVGTWFDPPCTGFLKRSHLPKHLLHGVGGNVDIFLPSVEKICKVLF